MKTPRVRVWTMRRGDRVPVCEALRHPLGLEIAVLVCDDVRRTQGYKVATDAQGKAEEWRVSFLDFGRTDAPDTSTEH